PIPYRYPVRIHDSDASSDFEASSDSEASWIHRGFPRFFFRHAPNYAYEAQLLKMRLAAKHSRKLMKEREMRERPYRLRPYVSKRIMTNCQLQEFLQTASKPDEDHQLLVSFQYQLLSELLDKPLDETLDHLLDHL
ncbi:hypothetical protein BGZ81_002289, partial [Podila clonocystis]